MTSHSCWKLYLCIVWKQKIQLILTLGLHNVAVPWSQRAPPLTTSDLPVVTPTAAKISSLLSSQLKRNPGWTSVLGHNASTSTKVRLNTTTIGILLQAAISLRARKRGGSRLRRTCALTMNYVIAISCMPRTVRIQDETILQVTHSIFKMWFVFIQLHWFQNNYMLK